MLWDCFQVSCFPGANHWIESPWCAGMFRQAWALPGGIRQNPPGCQGCALQLLTAERGSWLCKGPPATLWAPMCHMVDTSTPRTSPQHPWNTETERVLGSPLFIDSTSGQRMMGWFGTSVCLFFWSQGVLDEIQSGAWTHDALVGELICRNNAFVNLGHQRKKKQIYATEHLSEAPYENRPSAFTAVHLLTLQPTTVSLLGDTCWICHTSRTKL